jgi:hypothetical protein
MGIGRLLARIPTPISRDFNSKVDSALELQVGLRARDLSAAARFSLRTSQDRDKESGSYRLVWFARSGEG